MRRFRLSGDEGIGLFEPREIREPSFPRLDSDKLARLRRVRGLSATASDVLDELGCHLAVSADVLCPRHVGSQTLVGQALTLSYLPERRSLDRASREGGPPKFAHHVVYRLAEPGDVMVIDGRGLGLSVMGGRAAASAVQAGVGGAIVDAGIRDVDDIRRLGFPVWSRHLTPVTGKARAEAVAVNAAVCCGGVHVLPGDLVVADDTGICFIPCDLALAVIERIHVVADLESHELRTEANLGQDTDGPV